MELFLLPILALVGVAYLLIGGDDTEDETEEPTPEGEFNYIEFGPQDNTAVGTGNDDAMYLGIGDDRAAGGAGNDKIFLGDGQDSTVELNEDGSFETTGMAGDDFIRGGDGRDILVDALGSNTIYGDTGYDRMNSLDAVGDEGTADTMYGGFGEDSMFADNGDVMSGGGQNDSFNIIVTDNMAPVTITDFAAGDQLSIRDDEGGFQVIERISTDLAENGTDTNVMLDGEVVLVLKDVTEIPEDTFKNPVAAPMYGEVVRNAAGEIVNDDFNDDIEIDAYTHAVFAFGGDDTVSFAEGAATAERDMLVNGGNGDDTLTLGEGDDTIMGGLGNDVISGGGGNDEIEGGFGNDDINALDLGVPGGADTVFGGDGRDTLTGDDGDLLNGDDGSDDFVIDMNDPDGLSVSIGDFDPANETLTGEVALTAGVTPTVTFSTAVDEFGTNLGARVTVDGRVVAILAGVDPADLNTDNVSITNSNF